MLLVVVIGRGARRLRHAVAGTGVGCLAVRAVVPIMRLNVPEAHNEL
jgi:hypothetical protein